ncbi:unnamed protein product [Moneuplotes crassus]|uniref:Uncharacterized protein n=1 Tax=Euplotes crassus TaxID=5936 RepID=A0AAD2DA01_EUPCR|nr:unnamed protein product [Moneuplotes crassus]
MKREGLKGFVRKYKYQKRGLKAQYQQRKVSFVQKDEDNSKINHDVIHEAQKQFSTGQKIRKRNRFRTHRISLNLAQDKSTERDSYSISKKHIMTMKSQDNWINVKEKHKGRSSVGIKQDESAPIPLKTKTQKKYLTQKPEKKISKNSSVKNIQKTVCNIRKSIEIPKASKLLKKSNKKIDKKVMKAINRVYSKMKIHSNQQPLLVDLVKTRDRSITQPHSVSIEYMTEIKKKFKMSPQKSPDFKRCMSARKTKFSIDQSFNKCPFSMKNPEPKSTQSSPKKSLGGKGRTESTHLHLLENYAQKHSKLLKENMHFRKSSKARQSQELCLPKDNERQIVDVRMDDKVHNKPRFITIKQSSLNCKSQREIPLQCKEAEVRKKTEGEGSSETEDLTQPETRATTESEFEKYLKPTPQPKGTHKANHGSNTKVVPHLADIYFSKTITKRRIRGSFQERTNWAIK